MTKVREAGELFAFDHYALVATGVKAVPIAGKSTARWLELCPTFFPIERVNLLFVGARVMVDDHISEGSHFVLMNDPDEVLEFGAIAIESLYGALLIEVPKIEIVIGVVTR